MVAIALGDERGEDDVIGGVVVVGRLGANRKSPDLAEQGGLSPS